MNRIPVIAQDFRLEWEVVRVWWDRGASRPIASWRFVAGVKYRPQELKALWGEGLKNISFQNITGFSFGIASRIQAYSFAVVSLSVSIREAPFNFDRGRK